MARFTASIDVAAPVERVWARITDWPAHGRWIPLTTVRVTSARPDGLGAGFVGRSGLGPLGFDDPMEVVEWTPPVDGAPGYVRVQKRGRVVLGWAGFEVAPGPAGGSRVRWTEDVQVAPVRLTRPFGRLIEVGGRFGFDRALKAMAAEIEGEVRSDG
jgi:uncharacterized protein YndB with AHSA1/START domain